jgi:hypothetical protein
MNLGINIGLGCAAMMGHSPSPNDIRIAGSRVCKLWSETCPAIGTTTPSAASVPANMADWAGGNLGVGAISGSPEQIRGTTDNSRHYVYHADPTNDISSYSDITLVCAAVGAQQWIRVWSGARYCNFDIVNGAVGNKTATESGSTVTVAAGVATVTLKSRTVGACNARVELLGSDDANATPSNYVSSASDGFNKVSVAFTQIRASAQNNLARADDGTLIDATGGVQTTIANQPLILDQNGNFYTGASGQIPVVAREIGRTSYLSYTDADVLAAAAGDDTPFAVCGIWKGSGSGAAPCMFASAAGNSIIPVRIVGADLNTYRANPGGGGESDVVIGSNLAASAASWHSWAFLYHADRTWQYRMSGVEYTGSCANLASTPFDQFANSRITGTTSSSGVLFLALFAGELTYAQIQPVMLAACARYPGLGLVA